MALAAGDSLGPYEILALLDATSAGDTDETYQARDSRDNRIVAVKVSRNQFSEHFVREARAAAVLHHPHICALYEVGPNYLAMEFVEGVPLKGPLSLQETLRFATEICDALDYAEQRGIVHGDLKPSNILVTQQGVKLLNFGLAGDDDQSVGARSDIHAFGCVLYEMLMARRPAEDRRPVHPAALEKVLQKCLESDPARRFQSAGELKQALEGVAQSRGYPREYLIAAGSVVMLIVGLVLLVIQFPSYQKLSPKDVLVVGDFSNASGDKIFDGTLRAALALQLEQSPYLNIMNGEQVQQDLKRMGRTPDTRITNAIAHDICVREGQKAMIDGAIADLGKTFAITVQAVDCQNGATLARQQVQADGREQVLNAIAKTAAGLRVKLGEPRSSIQKLDGGLNQVTAGSVTAFQFYTLGIAQRRIGNNPASIAFFRHAIDLDPNFAIAYLELGRSWAMSGDTAKAQQAYQDFFARWKDTGADLPILAQAKKEFTALK